MTSHYTKGPKGTYRGEFARVSGMGIFCGRASLRQLGLYRRLTFTDLIEPGAQNDDAGVYANQNHHLSLNDIFR